MNDPKMTKVTIVSGTSLEDEYQRTLKYFRETYHKSQSSVTRDDGTSHPNEATDTSIPPWMTNNGKEVG